MSASVVYLVLIYLLTKCYQISSQTLQGKLILDFRFQHVTINRQISHLIFVRARHSFPPNLCWFLHKSKTEWRWCICNWIYAIKWIIIFCERWNAVARERRRGKLFSQRNGINRKNWYKKSMLFQYWIACNCFSIAVENLGNAHRKIIRS